MSPAARHRLDVALTTAAVLGALCIVATVLSLVLGVRPVIFETGSMAPTVPTGSIGFARTVPAADVRPGDIVTVTRDDGVRVTHRVVTVTPAAGTAASLTLRGDANASPDSQPYVVSTVYRTTITVPVVGYIASWLSAPHTLVLQAIAAAGLLAISFAPSGGWRQTTTGRRIIAGTAVATTVALGATAVHGVGDAAAAPLTGMTTATGNVNAGRPDAPASVECVNVLGIAGLLLGYGQIKIPNPPSQQNVYGYTLKVGTQVYTTKAPSSTNPVVVDVTVGLVRALLGTLFNGTFTVTVYATVGNFESLPGPAVVFELKTLPLLTVECQRTGVITRAGLQAQAKTSGTSVPSSGAPGRTSGEESTPPTSVTESSTSAVPPSPSQQTSASSAPATSETAELPPGGTQSPSGRHAFFRDGATVTIRNATSTAVEYAGDHSPASTVRWRTGEDVLEISALDGTVTTLTWTGSRWDETVIRPQTTEAPTTEPASPTTRSAEEAVPGVTSTIEPSETEGG